MSDLAVKIQHEDDVRRVNLKSTRFSDLLEIISTLFGIRADHYKICYLDEDKDSITVTTDLELKEALALAKKTNSILRLLIKESKGKKVVSLASQQPSVEVKESVKDSSQSNHEIFPATGTQAVLQTINESINALDQVATSVVQEPPKKADSPQLYEHEALCDICKNKISGIRYKCGNCDDFDLCEKCEALRLHDAEHIFLKLYKDISPVSKALLPLLYVPKPEPPKPREPLNAAFVRDVTIDEGTVLKKGQKFTKTWRLQNNGKEAWTPGCRLVMTDGSSLGTVNFVEVPCAKAGEEIDISVDLNAPSQPGRYVSYWRLSDSNGMRFGHRIWVDISVAEDKPEPIAQPVVTQPISIPVFQPVVSDPVPQPVVADSPTGPMFQVKVSEKSLKIRDSTNLVDVEFIITKENELVFRVTATKEVRMKHHLTHLKRWAVIENAITLDFAEWESGFITLQTPIASQIGSLISNRIESILEQAAPIPVTPAPTPVTEQQPVVPVPKVPEPVKETLPEGITESDMEKLAELGFTDRKRNIELLVKHKRDLVQVVTALLE